MNKKLLTGAMATIMAAGMVPTVAGAATTDVDALYKAAYKATIKALETKTQADVNAAREAVRELPTTMDWAIGEFSKQLDSVQHPILVNIVTAINKAEAEVIQANIDAARKTIPAELPTVWKNSYSSAIDKIQQGLQQQIVDAVKKAETEKTAEAIEAARVLVNDVLTAESQALKEWATIMAGKLDAIKTGLEITNVVSISKNQVKIEFKALKEALRDVSINILDNNGKKVEVDTNRLLIEGETEATFYFKSVLKEEPTGVWKINGFKVDLSERAFVTSVKEEKGDNLAKLLKNSKYVTGYVADNLKVYETEINNNASKINTAEDVQKIIDEVNKDVASKNEVKYVIEAAKTGTSTQFKNALSELKLERVNSKWMDEYKGKVSGVTENKVTKVQEVIDSLNTEKVNAAIAEIATSKVEEKASKIDEALTLVEDYIKEDGKNETTKANIIKDLNLQSALLRVNTAETVASLKSALVNLNKVVNDKSKFDYDKVVNENLMKDYLTKDVTKNTSVADIVNSIKTVEKQAVNTAISKITEKANVINNSKVEEKVNGKQALLDAFNKLQVVSAKAEVKFDASKVNADLYDLYAEQFTEVKQDVKAVQDIVTKVNSNIVESLLSKVSDKENLLKTLQDKRLGLTNVIATNDVAYQNELTVFKSITTSKDLVNLVNEINYKQEILSSKSVSEVKTALVKYVVERKTSDIINLKDIQRTDVAEELVYLLKDTKVDTLDSLDKLIGEANGKRIEMLKTVNNSKGNIENTQDALELISSEFKALDNTTKLFVAESFDTNRPKNDKGVVDFTNYTEIRALIAKYL